MSVELIGVYDIAINKIEAHKKELTNTNLSL